MARYGGSVETFALYRLTLGLIGLTVLTAAELRPSPCEIAIIDAQQTCEMLGDVRHPEEFDKCIKQQLAEAISTECKESQPIRRND